MNLILFDDTSRNQLLPFTHTRPVGDIRCGILTQRERWEKYLETEGSSTLTVPYLQEVFPAHFSEQNTYVNAAVFCTAELSTAIGSLPDNTALLCKDQLIAFKSNTAFPDQPSLTQAAQSAAATSIEATALQHVWDIFSLNDWAVKNDFALLTKGKKSQAIPPHVTVIHAEQVFLEDGATVAPCIINAATGPVYIGKDAEVMEGCMIRGPLALGEHAVLKMGAKVYGATTIGPGCKVGGEISNVVFFANSNKGHDGYLGNAVIGEWCNLGADTNCSNLKNNYDEIKVWNEYENKSVRTGLQFCGLIMGDHSKCGINTMFNTGTVAGVSCNIYGGGFPDTFIPSFSWGSKGDMVTYNLDKALDTAHRMMNRRNKQLSAAERVLFAHIFELTAKQRAVLHP